MNTFNDLKEFFPTPPELVAKMICNIRFKSDCSVLEPSAEVVTLQSLLLLLMVVLILLGVLEITKAILMKNADKSF